MGKIESHDSYGTLVFNRAHQNGSVLFGSNIKHDEIITMEINHASLERNYNNDFIRGGKKVVAIDMSYAQFAEAISSFGMYPGVPVTIRYTEKDGYVKERPEFKNKRTQLDEELKQQMDDISKIVNDAYKEVATIFDKKGHVTKADKEQILSIIMKIANSMSNTEYLHEQMIKEMDKVVVEAKSEIEAFTKRRIETIANDAIAQQQNEIQMDEKDISVIDID